MLEVRKTGIVARWRDGLRDGFSVFSPMKFLS